MIKTILFDLGGVLLRTVNPASREEMAKRFGTTREELEWRLFLSPTAIQSELGELSDAEHFRTVLLHYKQDEECLAHTYEEFFSGDEIDQKLLGYIRALRPHFKVGLLSNAWANARKNLSQLYDFLNAFDVAVFSAEVGLRKPDERIFRLLLRKLDSTPEETIFVDDFKINIDARSQLRYRPYLMGRQILPKRRLHVKPSTAAESIP